MFRPFMCVAYGVISLWAVGGTRLLADDPATPSSDQVAALVAPEFANHLDVDSAIAAFRADDSETLLAIAERLGTAENSTGKKNPALPALTLFRAAIQAAMHRNEPRRFEQLNQTLQTSKALSAEDRRELLAEFDLSQKLGGDSRRIDAGPGLKPNQVSAEAISLYNTFAREIRTTQEYGTEEDLELLVDGIRQLRELHPKQKEHLAKLAFSASVAIKERGGKLEPPLVQLVQVSRSLTSGWRVLGPSEVPSEGTIHLVVIPSTRNTTTAGQLQFRSSAGITVPKDLAWNGSPLVVPVTIKAAPGKPVFVSVGETGKTGTVSWNAQTARQ